MRIPTCCMYVTDGSGGAEAFRAAATAIGMTIIASVSIFNDQRTFTTQSNVLPCACLESTAHCLDRMICL